MTQLKRVIYQLFRLSPKIRQPLHQRRGLTSTVLTAVTDREPNLLRKVAHLGPKSNLQPLTDTNAKEVEEDEQHEDEAAEDDEDIPETVPYELTHKTHIEMMIHRLHVAVADSDQEIAALRTRHHETFSHILRITFAPPVPANDDNNIAPSNWSWEEIRSPTQGSGPSEFRLTCPAYARRLNHMALTVKQLHAARKYITLALPDRNAGWTKAKDGLEFPFLPAEEDARLLIVGPTDRPTEVMTVLVCYLAFLMGTNAGTLLDSVQRSSFVHHQWRSHVLGEIAGMADAAAKHEFQ